MKKVPHDFEHIELPFTAKVDEAFKSKGMLEHRIDTTRICLKSAPIKRNQGVSDFLFKMSVHTMERIETGTGKLGKEKEGFNDGRAMKKETTEKSKR